MNLERMLLRMAHWARNPPSLRQVLIWAVVIGLCLTLAGVEWLGLWPEALKLDKSRGGF